ncbi:MAG: Type pilus assembly protein PilM [Eubacteriaceae bacterium]|nr:Type pilus assembly protein PilM [Eubacteriaceae bacterium]
MRFKENHFWVADIGEESAKIIQAKKTATGSLEIVGTFRKKGLNKDTFILAPKKEAFEVLADCLTDYRRGDQITILMKDPAIVVEPFMIKAVSDQSLEDIVYWKMKKLQTSTQKKWHYDYIASQRLEVFEQLGLEERYFDVVAVYAEKNLIKNCQKLFKAGDYKVTKIIPQFIGLGKILEKRDGKNALFVDIGSSQIILYQYFKGILRHQLSIDTSQLNVENFTNISSSIENHMRLYQDKREREKSQLYLVGGGSLAPGVQEYFTAHSKWELTDPSELIKDELSNSQDLARESVSLFFSALAGLLV